MITEKEIITKEIESDSWFDDYDKPQENKDQLPIFEMKLKEGQIARTEKIVFLSDGKKATTRFGETVIFNIKHEGIDKVWFIKKTQYNLLNPIARKRKTDSLVGLEAEVQRAGSGAKDTKWSLTFK